MSTHNTPQSDAKLNYELGSYEGHQVIFIRFRYDTKLIAEVKKHVGVRWSAKMKAWYVTDNQHFRTLFGLEPLPIKGKAALMHIDQINQDALTRFISTLQLKAYCQNTILTYRNEFAQLLYALKETQVDTLDAEKLRRGAVAICNHNLGSF
jgi:integrase/recombinase XerD